MSDVRQLASVSLAGGQRALAAAVAEATAIEVPSCVAVADQAGHLLVFARMDGAPLLSSQIAQDKAYTVAAFGLPTHAWWELLAGEPALLHGIVKTDRLIVFGGGVPIVVGGQHVGSIGVSGGSAEQDRRVAEAGAAALE
jgi:glc operon protein GlcG